MGITHWDGISGENGVYEGSKNNERRIFGGSAKFAGDAWFVDTLNGSDNYKGTSWKKPFKTMQKAFNKISSGDAIYFRGKVIEQLTTPVNIYDVAIIGTSLRPRHIDGTAKLGSQSTAMWTESTASPATPLCKVIQQGWLFQDILFAGPADASCIQLFRDGGSGNDERDASHAEIHNCRFASGYDGIENHGGAWNVGIYDCVFTSFTNFAIQDTVGAGIGFPWRWELLRNHFIVNVNCIQFEAQRWMVKYNSFLTTTTVTLDLEGSGGGKECVVMHNYFNDAVGDWDEANGYVGNSTDVWGDNYCTDGVQQGVPGDT